MNLADVQAWEAKARANYIYAPDPVGQDIWTDHSADVLAGAAWFDDCDGLAMTVVALCVMDGLAKEKAARLFVRDINGVGHMVGGVECDDAGWQVVGDTWANAPYPVAQMQHTPVDYDRVSESGPGNAPEWRKGVPWRAGQALA